MYLHVKFIVRFDILTKFIFTNVHDITFRLIITQFSCCISLLNDNSLGLCFTFSYLVVLSLSPDVFYP